MPEPVLTIENCEPFEIIPAGSRVSCVQQR